MSVVEAEVLAEDEALALRDLELGEVVGHTVFDTRVVDADAPPVPSDLEAEEVPAERGSRARRP